MKSHRFGGVRLLGGAAAIALLTGLPAHGQANDDSEDGVKKLNTVTVTATRREESIQDVPIAVTALAPQELERQNAFDIRGLSSLSASFSIQSSQVPSQATSIRIRGVGTTGNNIGLESAVGVFLDGVYLARPGIALGDLVDLEQLEVLRGPQGTLFGRNTSAGALNITTRKPNLSEFDAFGNITGGELGTFNVQGGFSAPLIEDQLGFRFSGAYRQQDGILNSVATNPDGTPIESGNRDRFSLRAQLLWEPAENVSIRLIGDYGEADENCCDSVILTDPLGASGLFGTLGPVPSTGVVDPTGGATVVGFEGVIGQRMSNGEQFANPFEQWGISGQLDWDLGWANMTYIGAYRDFFSTSVQESDFVGLDIFSVGGVTGIPGVSDFPAFDDITSQTHELRFQGNAFDGRLDWLVGAFYSQEDILEEAALTLGADFDFSIAAAFGGALGPSPIEDIITAPNPLANVLFAQGMVVPGVAPGIDPNGSFSSNRFIQESRSWSIFMHNTFAVTDQWDVTVGLRWVDELKDGTFQGLDGSSPACLAALTNLQEGDLAFLGANAVAAVGATCFPFSTQVNLPGSGVPGGLPTPATFSDDPGEPGVFVDDFDDEELVWTIKTALSPTDDVTVYAGFTHGFKAGGFNLDSTAAILGADPRFESETIDAWELGLKADFWDGRARANIAVFHQDLSNFQVLEFTGVQFQTFNVPRALSTGIEIESQAQVTDQLTLTANMTYANARYPDNCADGANPVAMAVNVADLCGNQLTNAPEFVGIWGATWEDTFNAFGSELLYFGNVNVRFSTDRRTSTRAGNVFDIQDAYTKINLRAGIGDADGRWTLEGFVTNLTDEITRSITFNVPLRTGTRGAFIEQPRIAGATLRFRY